jgi:hypothetical protein
MPQNPEGLSGAPISTPVLQRGRPHLAAMGIVVPEAGLPYRGRKHHTAESDQRRTSTALQTEVS